MAKQTNDNTGVTVVKRTNRRPAKTTQVTSNEATEKAPTPTTKEYVFIFTADNGESYPISLSEAERITKQADQIKSKYA